MKIWYKIVLLPAVATLILCNGCRTQTGIHAAAESGNNAAVADFLAKDKNSVNAKNKSGQTPLHLASAAGKPGTVEFLLDNGAGIDDKDGYGKTAIVYAASSGNYDAVKILLLNHATVNGPAFAAASSRNKDAANSILAATNDITPLHYACIRNDQESVTKCLNKKWPVDAKDYEGVTPLHYAVKNGNTAIINLLIAQKANVNATDNDGMTPLHYAALFSTNQICELLLTKGANKNAKSNSGLTPGEIAVNSGRIDLVKCLK